MFTVPMPVKGQRMEGEDPSLTLSRVFGYEAFRSGQREVITSVTEGRDVLAVLPTSTGKSLCYQIPALVRPGLAIVVTPLVALMMDQVDTLRRKGVRASALKTPMEDWERTEVSEAVRSGSLEILYVSPERLDTTWFKVLVSNAPCGLSLVAIDEAHSISAWGHVFRPGYLGIGKFLSMFPEVPVVALTATADLSTRTDIVRSLGIDGCDILLSGFDRPNIKMSMNRRSDLRRDLLNFMEPRRKSSGIVFCPTRKKVEDVSAFLSSHGFSVVPYHAGMPEHVKKANLDMFLSPEPIVAVATIAFGMGIDKPDVRYVVHTSMPPDIESYYQEIGRAGRDGLASEAVMLHSESDFRASARSLRKSLDEAIDDVSRRHYLHRLSKLEEIFGIVESPDCRRAAVLRAFGESHNGGCGNCDRCLHPAPTTDMTELGVLIVKAVTATGQKYGQSHLADVLLGIPSEAVVMNEHDKLGVFGKSFAVSKDRIISTVRQMQAMGYLERKPGRGGLSVTETGWALLTGKTRLRVFGLSALHHEPELESAKPPSVPELPQSFVDMIEELRAIRDDFAGRLGLARDVVLTDRSILALAEHSPRDSDELQALTGIDFSLLGEEGEFLESSILTLMHGRDDTHQEEAFSLFA